jgi:glutamyl-tRNA synthetase
VHHSAAVFDLEKLLWLNHQHIQQRKPEDLAPLLEPFLGRAAGGLDLPSIVAMLQPRARTLREMAEQAAPFFAADDAIAYEEEAVRKHIKSAEIADRLLALRSAWADLNPFDIAETERSLRSLAEASGVSAAKYIHPLRIALTGRGASPPIFDVAVVLGRERVLARIDRLVGMIPELAGTG